MPLVIDAASKYQLFGNQTGFGIGKEDRKRKIIGQVFFAGDKNAKERFV
jgi:hypothetical protein